MLRTAGTFCVVALAASAGGGALTGAGIATKRLTSPPAVLFATVSAPASVTLPAPQPPAIPLPAGGSLELESLGGAVLASKNATAVRPTGSVAKTMTALLTLRAHPLQPGQPGPVLTMTSEDVLLYREAIAEQGSAVAVEVGERLSERQLLLMLLLPSANNIAETLARWVAGSDAAFVAQLNAAASAMGLRSTHFADPSGYSPQTVSTASDLVQLGRAAIAIPALAELVATRSTTLPDGTVIQNLNVLLGAPMPHWLGIKTGWTPQAGGCLLFAAEEPVGAEAVPVTLVGAVLGEPPLAGVAPGHPELGGAFQSARAATIAAFAGYSTVDLSAASRSITASLAAPWGQRSRIDVRALRDIAVVRGPVVVRLTVRLFPVVAPAPAGGVAGIVSGGTGIGPPLAWQLSTISALSGPGWQWRLLNG